MKDIEKLKEKVTTNHNHSLYQNNLLHKYYVYKNGMSNINTCALLRWGIDN